MRKVVIFWRCMRRECGREYWSVTYWVLPNTHSEDGSKPRQWWLKNHFWTAAVVIMWRKCICRGKKTRKASIGWVTLAYCMSLKVHGNILFILHKATRSSWDAISREKVKDICFKAVGFEENTTLLIQFLVTDSCVCMSLSQHKWVWIRLNVLLSVTCHCAVFIRV